MFTKWTMVVNIRQFHWRDSNHKCLNSSDLVIRSKKSNKTTWRLPWRWQAVRIDKQLNRHLREVLLNTQNAQLTHYVGNKKPEIAVALMKKRHYFSTVLTKKWHSQCFHKMFPFLIIFVFRHSWDKILFSVIRELTQIKLLKITDIFYRTNEENSIVIVVKRR